MKKVKVRVSDLPCVATTQGCYVEVECGGGDSGGGETSKIESISLNGNALSIDENKNVDINTDGAILNEVRINGGEINGGTISSATFTTTPQVTIDGTNYNVLTEKEANIQGALNVGGATTISAPLTASGITSNGELKAQTAVIDGSTKVEGGFTTNGLALLQEDAVIQGTVTIGATAIGDTALTVNKSADISGALTVHGNGVTSDSYALTTTTALVSDTLTAINIKGTSANFSMTPTVGTDKKEVLVKNTLTAQQIEENKQDKSIAISGFTANTVEGALKELKETAGGVFLKGTVESYLSLPTEGDYEVGAAFVATYWMDITDKDKSTSYSHPKGIYYLADNTPGAFVWKHIASATLNFKGYNQQSYLPSTAEEGDIYFCPESSESTDLGLLPAGLYIYYNSKWHSNKDTNVFVTTDTDQTISGTKTFNTTPKDSKGNLLNQDDLTTINDTKQSKEISIEGITATTVEGALAELKSSEGGSSLYNHVIRISYDADYTTYVGLNVVSSDSTVFTFATLLTWLSNNGFKFTSSAIFTTYNCSGYYYMAGDTTRNILFGCAVKASVLYCISEPSTYYPMVESEEYFKFVDTVIKIS